ncbi:MAG TPA: hypothetical protein VG711_10260, partial [Phycisphaerales bacterium]|nr:hypothetical protein [Phycisphaerales bacterium]
DWTAIQVEGESGCDAVVRRHLENPEHHRLVFTQAPPGLCGCVVSAGLMKELSGRTRLSAIGPLLVYQPQAPQPDPIARDANVQIPHEIRRGLVRVIADDAANPPTWDGHSDLCDDPVKLIEHVEAHSRHSPTILPGHVILELTTRRTSSGIFSKDRMGAGRCGLFTRSDMNSEMLDAICEHLPTQSGLVVTLDGVGDALLHPHIFDFIRTIKTHARAVHLRTELLVDSATLKGILECGVDVLSIDVNADRANTYQVMMGCDRFKDVLLNIEWLIAHRRTFGAATGAAAFGLPWIVPRIQRREETFADIETFFDRWVHTLGTAVIDSPLPFDHKVGEQHDSLTPAVTPPRVCERELLGRMTILSDGSVPVSELDLEGRKTVGNVGGTSLQQLWSTLHSTRMSLIQNATSSNEDLRLRTP